MKYDYRHAPGADAPQRVHLVEGEGQRRRHRSKAPNGNFPSPQDFYNLEADYGTSAYDQPLNNTTSVVWELPFGRGKPLAVGRRPGRRGAARRLDDQRHQHDDLGRSRSTLIYTPATAFQVSGISQDFRGANNYRPNVERRSRTATATR